jgi:hypothetical protein
MMEWVSENPSCFWLRMPDHPKCIQYAAHGWIRSYPDRFALSIIFYCDDEKIEDGYDLEYPTLEEAKLEAEKILGLT